MLAGDNGILQRATDAKQTSERAEAKEQAQMDIMAYIADKTANHQDASLDDAKVKAILNGKSYVKDGQPGNESFITTKGEYEIPYSELYTATETIPVDTVSEPTDVYVALYNDGTLAFSNNSNDIDSSKVKTSYGNIRDFDYGRADYQSNEVTKVNILNKIVPTSCAFWFSDCYYLTEIINIENLDTSCVTNMEMMFSTCESLVADISSFDTRNVTNMSRMFGNSMNDDFGGAAKVTGWENFDVSNVTEMEGIFYDGGSGGRLEAVLDFCIRATKIPIENKTLSYLRLGPSRASICQTLPNYQDFLNAGWTTGY